MFHKLLAKLNVHHTYGVLLVALGAAQSNLTQLQSFISAKTFALLTMGLGVAVSALGFLKSDGSGS